MLKLVPDVVSGQEIRALTETASARDAGALMTTHDISAVVVNNAAGQLIGIVTERDLSRRVVAEGRDAASTPLAAIMTREPTTLSATDTAYDAMQTMRRLLVRHLPVVEDGRVVAMVSVRDLRHAIAHEVVPAHHGVGSAIHRWLRRLGV